MANRFLSNIRINDAYTLPASDGTSGQVISTDGAGNLSFTDASTGGAPIMYRDDFAGDGSTVLFQLANPVSNIVQTQVYIDGTYQEKETYSVNGQDLTFLAAPPNGTSIEVISLTSINFAGDFVLDTLRFTGGTADQGTLSWNTEDETLDLIVSPNVTYQIGQELGHTVRNLSGVTLNNGAVVRVTGASGNKITVDLADNTAELGSSETFAVVTETISNNSTGKVTTEGLVRGLDTSAFAEGVAIWLGTNGAFTDTKPLTPNHLVHIGWVVRSHATEGAILVKVSNGWEMEELHDVLITNVADKDMLVWNSTLGYWENSKTLGDITTGNITTDGTVDGVDISAFKAAYDVHTHVEGDITDFGNYLTNITHDTVNNKLVVTTRDAATFDVDLSQYIDDTNLARLTSGSLDAGTGIATFTRDDATTFTVDFSALFDDTDTNDFLTGASFNTADGVLTLNVSNQTDVTVDLDGRYLESYTETDTLATVTGRGATTTSDLETGRLTIANNVSTGGFGSFDDYQILLYNTGTASTSYGIGIESFNFMFNSDDNYRFYVDNSLKATISNSGDLTLTGTISASGYNNSNWDTAYGWGDHSTAGYQSASSAITTSNIASQSVSYATNAGTLNVTANDTFSGTYSLLWHSGSDVYSSSFMTINGSTDTLNVPNVNVSGTLTSGTLTVDGTYDGSFGFTGMSWGGSSTYPTLYSSHPDRWVMHIKPHIVWTQNGQRGYTGNTEGSMIRFEGNLGSTVSWDAGCLTDIASGGDYWGVARSGSWAFYSDPSLNLHANSSMRAPVFYDSNNTAWYTNPADRSILNTLQLGGASSDTTNLKLDVQGNMAIRGSSGLYYGVTSNNYNSWTTKMYASGSTQYLNAQQFIFDNQGYGSTTFLTVNTNGIYAPVFYDSSDTNYYVNPNGVSYMNQIDGPYFRNIAIPQSGLGSSYDERVLLLIPKVETNDSYNNRVHGKFTIGKTGGNVIDYFDVEAQSVYNNTTASFTSSGQRTGHKFVTCTYNGIKWLAIKFNYTANPYNYAWFHGHAITNFSTQAQTDMLKIISYVDLQSGTTVLNSEIYNSIADYTPDPLHKTMHNGSGSSYNMHSRLNLYAPGSGWEDGLNLYASDKTNKWNLLVDNGASDMFRVAFNSSEKFRIQTNGEVYTIGTGLAGSDYRAPIFYDSDNTGYYVDPAGLSYVNEIRSNEAQANPRYDTAFYVLQAQHWYGDNSSQTMYIGESGNTTHLRGKMSIGGTTIDSGYALSMGGSIRMYGHDVNHVSQLHFNDNVRFYDDGNDNYLNFKYGDGNNGGIKFLNGSAAQQGYLYADINGFGLLSADGTWAVQTTNSATTIHHNARSPLFYDSDNTGYYVDPNSTSRLENLTVTHFGIANSSSTSLDGIALYGGYTGGEPTYGLLFTGTALGTHGSVTGSWATYFTMNNDNSRGWIFRRVGSGNCASISGGGHATFDGSVTTPFIDINKTSANGPGMDLTFSGSNSTGILIRNNTAVTAQAISFYYSSLPQGPRGSITVSSTSTAYNTSSDYRLKENVIPMTGSLERVDQLKPARFNFIGDDKTVDGFLAHEAAEVVPEAVTGTKDEVDSEGNPIYQGIDQAKLVPLLVGAIQELKAEVEALKQKLNGTN